MSQTSLFQSQSLADWLSYLEQIHPKTIDLGLERVGTVARRMGVDRLPGKVITVGGTNGKGTTCAMLESMLAAAGYRVGVYASPHLLRYNERVRIDGDLVSDAALCQAFAQVEQARGELSLTFFEFGTLAALWLFRQAAPDVTLLEVGLGGRLDATNLIDADVAVITSIALDHCDWLGPDRQSIAREKAGIFRAGRPAISGEPQPPASLEEQALLRQANLLQVGRDYRIREVGETWCFDGLGVSWSELPVPVLPLVNAGTAVAALLSLGLPVSREAVAEGLRAARLPGRLQQVRQSPGVWVDVAHNPHAAAYLASALQRQPHFGRRLAVVGMLQDKDIAGTLAQLEEWVDVWFIADLHGPRAASAAQLAACLPASAQLSCHADVDSAYGAALAAAGPLDMILVFGSFYTVADVLAREQS
ncbi:bifunctional tetrahydrofolate synthase/dihydrofolate synthase [Pseudaeromonas paramecii]|uniref:Dihydrofolate synthase/folylpolyglutamate synthase n=1 Tax=Pseudaeromonas paramecii TaxID=2138166 RepID=A0ABP8Q2F3_9GAMM